MTTKFHKFAEELVELCNRYNYTLQGCDDEREQERSKMNIAKACREEVTQGVSPTPTSTLTLLNTSFKQFEPRTGKLTREGGFVIDLSNVLTELPKDSEYDILLTDVSISYNYQLRVGFRVICK